MAQAHVMVSSLYTTTFDMNVPCFTHAGSGLESRLCGIESFVVEDSATKAVRHFQVSTSHRNLKGCRDEKGHVQQVDQHFQPEPE
jgi:hypothetical protein